jgi:diguanylate cyclase (GGDEF)-like protein
LDPKLVKRPVDSASSDTGVETDWFAGQGSGNESGSAAAAEAHARTLAGEAAEACRRALASGDTQAYAAALRDLGCAELDAGSIDVGIATLERADEAYAKLAPHSEHEHTLTSLISAYETAGRHREALAGYRRLNALKLRLDPTGKAQWRWRAEQAEAEIQQLREELAKSQKRWHEMSELNAHLLRADQQKTALLLEAERTSMEDSVTGVQNRRSLDMRLGGDAHRARRYNSALTAGMLDIDGFKQINDTLSHARGDALLRQVAHLLHTRLRDSDYVARYGGDEFALVFPETNLANAVIVCESLREIIAHKSWEGFAPDMRVTVSIGLAELSDKEPTAGWLLDAADRMLYTAKRAGRNCVKP